jgi:arylsulfate sulfotransferase
MQATPRMKPSNCRWRQGGTNLKQSYLKRSHIRIRGSSLATRHPSLCVIGAGLTALALLSFGCGANNASISTESGTQASPLAQSIQVQITPLVAGVLVGHSQQFAASVSGTSNTAVKWAVNGVAGGNASLGQISATGVYTAPANAPSAALSITAISQASSGAVGTAAVAVMAPGTVSATNNPQVAQYSITVPREANVSVQFGPTTSYGLKTWTVPTPSGGGPVNILVAGMRASTTYHMQAVVDFLNGNTYNDVDQTYTTGALPASRVPQVVATQAGTLAPNSGIELLALTAGFSQQVEAAAVDLQGNVVWYYDFPQSEGIGPEPIKLLSNGHMLVVLGGINPVPANVIQEVDLAGNIYRQLSVNQLNRRLADAGSKIVVQTIHHDILPLANGHTIVLANTEKSFTTIGNTPFVLGDVLIDLDQNWNPVWTWNTFDHLDVNRHPMNFPDWTHSNAVLYTDDGDLLLSMRHQNWIIKIDYNNGQGTGNILWKLGQGGDFALTNGTDIDWFYAQHYPLIISPNSSGTFQLALWDNGNDRIVDSSGDLCGAPGQIACYSRPAIYQVDEATKTATLVWQDNLSIFTPWGGSVESLANGDFEFDANSYAGVMATVFEVTQTTPAQPVWQLQINGQAAYRAFRIPSLYPGVQW